MKPEIKAAWVAALRSGKYHQGAGQLRSDFTVTAHCCLGVLCELHLEAHPDNAWVNGRYLNHGTLPPFEVTQWAGLDSSNPEVLNNDGQTDRLTSLNDNYVSFNEIADIIERQL